MPFNPFMPVGDPYMPPGFLDAVRRQQQPQPQPTFQSVSHRPRSPMEDYRRPEIPPAPRAPIDVATPPQPAAAQPSPTGWWENLQKMLQSASAGIDPARMGLQGMFGQQQPRTIQTTDPGAGYGMSPSGPTARLGSAQFPDTPSDAPRAGTWMHGNVQRPKGQGVIEQFSVPANYGQSPSNPNWQSRPKPMSPFFEPPRPPVGGP